MKSKPLKCRLCGGSGYVLRRRRSDGPIEEVTCPTCKGSGTV